MQFRHVPSIPAATYQNILDFFTEAASSATSVDLVAEAFPSLKILDVYVQLYFEYVHPRVPCIHRVTFDLSPDAWMRVFIHKSDDQFHDSSLDVFEVVNANFWDNVYNVLARKLGPYLPLQLAVWLSPAVKLLTGLADEVQQEITDYKIRSLKDDRAAAVIDAVAHLPNDIVLQDAGNILFAGSDTTAFTLQTGTWHMAKDRKVKRKLELALQAALPKDTDDIPTLLELESIPYLVACVKESLRIAMPVPGRLPRIVPTTGNGIEPLIVDGKLVPAGTTVGMSAYTMHFSEEIWGPDAKTFNPDRWLGDAGKGMDQYLVTFSKGARNCIGLNIAQAELIMVFGVLFRKFEVDVHPSMTGELKGLDFFSQICQRPGLVLDLKTGR